MRRRRALGLIGGALPAWRWAPDARAEGALPIAPGPFQPTRASLEAWTVPDWFRDAKFGIWAHWGPQSAPEAGDWYARQMYQQGHEQYEHHVKTFGHPSKVGFKDVIPTWKAEAFDPAALMKTYKRAGAKYFVTMGVHHDNFDLWDSKHQPRWNAAKVGPRRDVVGEFGRAARAEGLRFGVSEHLWVTYKWFSISRDHDDEGPLAGVPYDGGSKDAADLYQACPEVHRDLKWDESGIAGAWKRHWFDRIQDLVDQHQPDLLYSDSWMPFGDIGVALVAHLYNRDAAARGRVEAVYTSKGASDCERGTCVYDVERGMVESIWPRPWSSHTCVGNWHYRRGQRYKSAKIVVDTLVDVVSRNGNLLLNFPLRSNGTLDADEHAILDALGSWFAVNGEAIYGTRPWRTFGEGPSAAPAAGDAKFNEASRKELAAADVRYTSKGDALYAFLMADPGPRATIAGLAPGGPHAVRRIARVERAGRPQPLQFTQDAKGLTVELPARDPSDLALALKILGA